MNLHDSLAEAKAPFPHHSHSPQRTHNFLKLFGMYKIKKIIPHTSMNMLFYFLKFGIVFKVWGHLHYKQKAEKSLILLLNCHGPLLHIANIKYFKHRTFNRSH